MPRGGLRLLRLVYVGDHRHVRGPADLGEPIQPLLDTRAAKARDRGPVGLIEGGLEDIIETKLRAVFFHHAGGHQRLVKRIEHAGAGGDRQPCAADRNVPHPDLFYDLHPFQLLFLFLQ